MHIERFYMEPFASAVELMRLSPAAILTTLEEDGSPWTRAMLNLRNARQYPKLTPFFDRAPPLTLYFTTNTSSPKMQQLRRDPRVSVYFTLPEKWWGLTLTGRIEEVESSDLRRQLWQDGWEMYYPEGTQDPDYSVLRLEPERGRLYRQLESWNLDMRGAP